MAELLGADDIHIIVGRAINPAHQSPDVPVSFALKHKIINEPVSVLEKYSKYVTVSYY